MTFENKQISVLHFVRSEQCYSVNFLTITHLSNFSALFSGYKEKKTEQQWVD